MGKFNIKSTNEDTVTQFFACLVVRPLWPVTSICATHAKGWMVRWTYARWWVTWWALLSDKSSKLEIILTTGPLFFSHLDSVLRFIQPLLSDHLPKKISFWSFSKDKFDCTQHPNFRKVNEILRCCAWTFDVWILVCGHDRCAGGQTAATDGYYNGIQVRHLRQQLQTHSTLATHTHNTGRWWHNNSHARKIQFCLTQVSNILTYKKFEWYVTKASRVSLILV